MDLLTASATQIASGIAGGQISSRDAVEVHIAKINEINPVINAVVADRFEAARAEADLADQAIRDGKPTGTFHGVPCSIKECFALTGMPNTSGLVAREDFRPDVDATAVQRLRAAGAIPLGVTNTSELCMWMESSNRVYGRTNNPYDPARIVGGSSGGEGAIIGGGGTPFGLGSDVGGSIRMPAFFNGVFGHKPTGTMVPATGQYPTAKGDALRYLTTGPLSRRGEDLYPLLKILAGPDGNDERCTEWHLGDPRDVKLEGLRVVSVAGNGRNRVSPDLSQAQVDAASALARSGALVTDAQPEALRYSFDIWSSMLGSAQGRDSFKRDLQRSAAGLWGQLLLWMFRASPHTLPAILLGFTENIGFWTPGRTRKFIDLGHQLRAELQELIGDGVMLYPSYAMPAPKHYRPLNLRFDWVYAAIMNVMEFPSTQVPLGLNDRGLPLGVQVVGAPGNDHITIAVALELERQFGGWVPPWGDQARGS